MKLPAPRGPVSAAVIEALSRDPHVLPTGLSAAFTGADPVRDDDLQLVLHVCHELHYQGWDGVDERWEWNPSLLALRTAAEDRFETALYQLTAPQLGVQLAPDQVPIALTALVAADDGPSLAKHLQHQATLEQFSEFVRHRSVYHLKEADPHTWGIPRLAGRAKAALVEIQIDEYGGGRLGRSHADLFRATMISLGLDATYGRYVDDVPAVTLAVNNLISLFGLHRRLRGALIGHLAAFEMTSSVPNRRYGNGLRRLGGTPAGTRFYDEHVEADAVHEQIAAHDLAGGFAADNPDRAEDVLFGAAACLAVDRLFAEHLLDSWAAGRTSLRP